MNIKQAKIQIKQAIQAYLSKDMYGEYRIPVVRQRPVLVIGAPGIGKTAIMEQIARECVIGLVSYTMTHHTRQTAIGLPFIREKKYGGEAFSVTEYTMSEIIAAVYEKIEDTGLKEGILFLDEINCVSETLAPTMLQFLQYKTFGNHRLPKGWIIVAAGNPPEYNKSVREFDVVTLDRVKKIDVEENFNIWKEYAYERKLHGAVITYLEIKKEHFYDIQNTVDGKIFVTARGWEDLSEMLLIYEDLNLPVEEELIVQYVQHPKIAKDFANYYDLYCKYQDIYHVDEILKGNWSQESSQMIGQASFDEKLSIIGLLLDKLSGQFMEADEWDRAVSEVFDILKQWKMDQTRPAYQACQGTERLGQLTEEKCQQVRRRKKAGMLGKRDYQIEQKIIHMLESYQKEVSLSLDGSQQQAFERVKTAFNQDAAYRKQQIEAGSDMLECAFQFMEDTFGESQEMVIFITELSANYYSIRFISQHGCKPYYQYNKELLFQEKQKAIIGEIEEFQQKQALEL